MNVPSPSASFSEATSAIASILATGGRRRANPPLGVSRSSLAPSSDTAASYPQPPTEAGTKAGRMAGWQEDPQETRSWARDDE